MADPAPPARGVSKPRRPQPSPLFRLVLQQIFEVDPLSCPTGHGPMRIVAFLTQASVIDRS